MDDVAALESRIESLGELRRLFRALRALAAMRLQEATSAVVGADTYVRTIKSAVAEAAALVPAAPLAASADAHSAGERMVVAIGAEHGFVGAFNERILAAAETACGVGAHLGVVGRRAVVAALGRGLEPAWTEPLATQATGVLATARRVADRCGSVDAVTLAYARPKQGMSFTVHCAPILPLDLERLAPPPRTAPPLHHLPARALMWWLGREYLLAEIASALLATLAAENGARVQLMQAADDNSGDKLDHLRRRVRAARQQAITAELLDVVTGAEVILHPHPR